jgi:hypothetical protein
MLALSLVGSFTALAQTITLEEGSIQSLKNQKSIKVEFTYHEMRVKGLEEAVYVTQTKEELNKKEAGRGTEWEKSWKADRKKNFEPLFHETFSKYGKVSTYDGSAKYTLIFNTLDIDPGESSFAKPALRKALLSGEAIIMETKNRETVIAKLSIMNVPGKQGGTAFTGGATSWMNYDAGIRIRESYAKAGKMLGEFIVAQIK